MAASDSSSVFPKATTNGGYPIPISPPYPALSKEAELSRAKAASIRSEAYSLSSKDIIFEDEWLVLVNKPSGIYCEALLSALSSCSRKRRPKATSHLVAS